MLQKHGDPPPTDPCEETLVVEIEIDDPDAPGERKLTSREEPCGGTEFEGPLPSTQHQRWPGDYNNDGRGGWERQGMAMIRKSKGRSTEQPR